MSMERLVTLMEHPHAPRFLPALIARVNGRPAVEVSRVAAQMEALVGAGGTPEFVAVETGPPNAPSLVEAIRTNLGLPPAPTPPAPAARPSRIVPLRTEEPPAPPSLLDRLRGERGPVPVAPIFGGGRRPTVAARPADGVDDPPSLTDAIQKRRDR